MKKLISFTLLAVCIVLLNSCTPKKMASDITSQIMLGGAPSFEMEPDIEIAENTGLTMIKMIEAMQYDNQQNKSFKLLLARSYANYAFGFFEYNMLRHQDKNPEKYQLNLDRAKRFYENGKRLGIELLGSTAKIQDLEKFKRALKGYGKGDVPKLFWTAFNWGSWINLSKDSPQAIIEFPRVEAIMLRVLELDEHYFQDGPNLFFAVSYGSRPTMFGGNPDKSKAFFEKALASYQRKFLMTQVLYAQIYAVQTQDPALFDSLLNEVLAADATKLPEQRLANEMAKKRAALLLSMKEKFFNTGT